MNEKQTLEWQKEWRFDVSICKDYKNKTISVKFIDIYRKTSKWSKPEFKFNTVTLFLTT